MIMMMMMMMVMKITTTTKTMTETTIMIIIMIMMMIRRRKRRSRRRRRRKRKIFNKLVNIIALHRLQGIHHPKQFPPISVPGHHSPLVPSTVQFFHVFYLHATIITGVQESRTNQRALCFSWSSANQLPSGFGSFIPSSVQDAPPAPG